MTRQQPVITGACHKPANPGRTRLNCRQCTPPSSSVLANRHRCYRTHHCARFWLFFYIRHSKCLYHCAKIDRYVSLHILCFGDNTTSTTLHLFFTSKLQKNSCQILTFYRNVKNTFLWSHYRNIYHIVSNLFNKYFRRQHISSTLNDMGFGQYFS